MKSLRGEAWYIETSRKQGLRKRSEQEIDWEVYHSSEPLPDTREQQDTDEEQIEDVLLEKLMPLVLQSLVELKKITGDNETVSVLWSDAVRMTKELDKFFTQNKERWQRERDPDYDYTTTGSRKRAQWETWVGNPPSTFINSIQREKIPQIREYLEVLEYEGTIHHTQKDKINSLLNEVDRIIGTLKPDK